MSVSSESYKYISTYEAWRVPLMVKIDVNILDAVKILRMMLCHLNITYEVDKWKNRHIVYMKGRPANIDIRIFKDINDYYIEFLGITAQSIKYADDIKNVFSKLLKINDEQQIGKMCSELHFN